MFFSAEITFQVGKDTKRWLPNPNMIKIKCKEPSREGVVAF
jgi:hypothetical protein